MYLTLSLDDDAAKADDRLNHFLVRYYDQPAPATRRRQACYAGPAAGLGEWLNGYVEAGADHLVLRFAGDHERHLDAVANLRDMVGNRLPSERVRCICRQCRT